MNFFDSARPLVFAHRGGCDLGPENTLAAFDRGLATGADGLELDVHLSSDGIVVVHHDDTLDRTTNATGAVAARTAAELQKVDAGCRFAARQSPAAVDGHLRVRDVDVELTGVPTLRDVLRRYPGARIIVEMKVDSVAMGQAVAREIRDADAVTRVCAAGYGLRSLTAVREALPAVATSASFNEVRVALYRSWARWPARRPPYGGYQVPEFAGRMRVVSRQFIQQAHARGLKVQLWTIDTVEDMQRLLEWGVDGLISNRPDLAVRVRDSFVARGA